MRAEQSTVRQVGPPEEPCEKCGASEWRDSVTGELFGSVCLKCGHNQLGQIEFGPVQVIELPDPSVTIHADGSATIDFGDLGGED